jgi:hypothetical protein
VSEPWKVEPLTLTPADRIEMMRHLTSARGNLRNLTLAQTPADAARWAGLIEGRLRTLQKVIEGKVALLA